MKPEHYTFEADSYCEACTEDRFGRCPCGFVACPGGGPRCGDYAAKDSEWNEIGACFFCEADYTVVCAGCGEVLHDECESEETE